MAQYFNLTLDTTAPVAGSWTVSPTATNTGFSVAITATGANYQKVWLSTDSTGASDIPSTWSAYSAAAQTITPAAEGTYYAFAQFMDEVGNITSTISYGTALIYDTTAPSFTNSTAANTNVASFNASLTVMTDNTGGSGLDKIEISEATTTGHITTVSHTVTADEITAQAATVNVPLTVTSGTPETIGYTIKLYDKAGNSTSISGNVLFDDVAAEGKVYIRIKDDGGNWTDAGAYTNTVELGAKLVDQTTTATPELVGYKLWWDSATAPTTWETYGSDKTKLVEPLATQFTGEGSHTLHAKFKDNVGNESDATASIIYDATAPSVIATADKTVISANSGYDTVTLSFYGTDTNNLNGCNWAIYVQPNGGSAWSELKNGTFTSEPSATAQVTQAITDAEIISKVTDPQKVDLKVVIWDKAGNDGESSVINVSLDHAAPTETTTGSAITLPSQYISYQEATGGVTATISATDAASGSGDAAGMSQMKIWVDTETTGSTSDWVTYASSYAIPVSWWTSYAEGAHTLHIQFKDAVGNTSTTYDFAIVKDIEGPNATSVALSDATYTGGVFYTNAGGTHTFTVNVDDAETGYAGTGPLSYKIWGTDIGGEATEPSTWTQFTTETSGTATYTMTLTAGDGDKTFECKLKDGAGNETAFTTQHIYLDTQGPSATLKLYNTGHTTEITNTNVNVVGFEANVVITDTDAPTGSTLYYKLSGDLTTPSADWVEYTGGTTGIYVDSLSLTTGDAVKTITLDYKDTSGNAGSVSATVTLDTTAPTVDTGSLAYNIIGVNHTARQTTSGPATYQYNDMVYFKFIPSESCDEYKVCVNASGQTAEAAVAIGTTHGSINMSGNTAGCAPSTGVECVIQGQDLAAACGLDPTATDIDVVKEIIVYVKDSAGQWSAVHSI